MSVHFFLKRQQKHNYELKLSTRIKIDQNQIKVNLQTTIAIIFYIQYFGTLLVQATIIKNLKFISSKIREKNQLEFKNY